jgi:hypothetical protein
MTQQDFCLSDLQSHVCFVKFTKLDGSIREMRCTLKEDLLPPVNKPTMTGRVPNPNVVSVWSVDDEGWRSFRKDSVLEFTLL